MTLQLPARDSFATDIIAVRHYRFACPHCAQVLKVKADAVGRSQVRGRCPNCGLDAEFRRDPEAEKSRTARALQSHLCARDSDLREDQLQRLALLLAQGTCRDYAIGSKLLPEQGLSPREWRRTLKEAAVGEVLRRRLEQSALRDALAPTISFCEACGEEAAAAWEIAARFIHHERHGDCAACRENPTGLACVYLHFETFREKCGIQERRAERWRRAVREMIGV